MGLYCFTSMPAVAGYMMLPILSLRFASGSLGCDVQLSKKWQLFRPRMEGLAAGLRTVAKNAAGASSAVGHGGTPDAVAALKQLLAAISEPAGEALAALSRSQPQVDMQTWYGQARTSSYERPLSMHDAGFGIGGEDAAAGVVRPVSTEQHHAAAKIAADTQELLAQLTAAQQAAEAVTASLQDTASRVRHNAAAPGARQRTVRQGHHILLGLALDHRVYTCGCMHRC